MARDLGVHSRFLRDLGVLEKEEVCGWNITVEPDVEDLKKCREAVLEERKRRYLEWAEAHGKTVEEFPGVREKTNAGEEVG